LKKRGIVYTPHNLAYYMGKSSIDWYFVDNLNLSTQNELKVILESQIDEKSLKRIIGLLKDIKLLDPAIGSGNILIQVIEILVMVYTKLWDKNDHKLLASLALIQKSGQDREISRKEFLGRVIMEIILSKNISGYEIDEIALHITKTRIIYLFILKAITELENWELLTIPLKNIQKRDFLHESSLEAISKKYNIIIANPPYKGESGNKKQFRQLNTTSLSKYYEAKMDLWYFFFHRAIDISEERAIITFIASNYWLTASGASKLRKRIMSYHLVQLIDFKNQKVFSNAQGIHTNIITIKKLKDSNKKVFYVNFSLNEYNCQTNLEHQLEKSLNSYCIDQKKLKMDWDDYLHFLPPVHSLILDQITKNAQKITDSNFYVKQGLITGLNKITNKYAKRYNFSQAFVNNGVFILDKKHKTDAELIRSLNDKERSFLKPFYKNSDIRAYFAKTKTDYFVLYLNKRYIKVLDEYPNIKNHLDKYTSVLKESSDNAPYLHRPRENFFSKPKLCCPQRTIRNEFGISFNEWFAAQDVYFILEKNDDIKKLKRLSGFLNSKLAYFWFSLMGKKKGNALELFSEPLELFPLKQFDKYPIEVIVDVVIMSKKDNCHQKNEIKQFFEKTLLNAIVYDCYLQITNDFELILRNLGEFSLKDISKLYTSVKQSFDEYLLKVYSNEQVKKIESYYEKNTM
jgi:adenine-specific DNA-methyltransferase